MVNSKPHHNGTIQLSQELAVAKQRIVELEKQRDELVVESAGLKDINAWCKTEAFGNMYREFKTAEALGCTNEDCMHDAMMVAIMHSPGTPATDAAIAEIGDKALRKLSQRMKDNGYEHEAAGVIEYANKLRGGGV